MTEVFTLPLPVPVRIGRWWFRNRSLSPLPLFLLMGALPADFSPGPALAGAAFAVIALAEGLRVWAVGYAGSATRTRGDTVPRLVTAGPFRLVRNPLYIANIAMYTAASVLFGFKYLSVIIFFYSLLQYTFIVKFEEDTLGRLFGNAYRTYRAQVPRWMFSVSPTVEPSSHRFELAKALRSERSTFFSMLLMGALYLFKRTFLAY